MRCSFADYSPIVPIICWSPDRPHQARIRSSIAVNRWSAEAPGVSSRTVTLSLTAESYNRATLDNMASCQPKEASPRGQSLWNVRGFPSREGYHVKTVLRRPGPVLGAAGYWRGLWSDSPGELQYSWITVSFSTCPWAQAQAPSSSGGPATSRFIISPSESDSDEVSSSRIWGGRPAWANRRSNEACWIDTSCRRLRAKQRMNRKVPVRVVKVIKWWTESLMD